MFRHVNNDYGMSFKKFSDRGWQIKKINEVPGQPDLLVDDLIVGINGESFIPGKIRTNPFTIPDPNATSNIKRSPKIPTPFPPQQGKQKS